MHNVFWFVPGRLAGRSGPSKDPWNLQQLRDAGIGAILSVNDGALCHPADFERAGLSYQCSPLSPNAPPEDGDLEHCLSTLPKALEYVLRNEHDGLATLVHCHSGKDRTGLFLAYYAVRTLGMSRHEAIASVRAVRPIAFSAPGWEEFALQVLAASTAPKLARALTAPSEREEISMGNGNTTTVTVSNLSTAPISYAITSGTPGQEPIVGSLPGRSYGIIELEFSQEISVTVGDQQVTVGPNGMVTFVPPGVSGLVGTFEFSAPSPSA